jgi:hypothetical protein
MTVEGFSYHAMLKAPATPPSGLIAVRAWSGPLQAVVWHVPKRRWIFAPAIAAPRIFDDQYADRNRSVDRPTAERIAREYLGTELPTEEHLHRICEEGARQSET